MPIETAKSSFVGLIKKNAIYVDKTKYIYTMLEIDKLELVFLSRPRRFGKSLMLSTLEALFLGKREFFKNLYIDSTNYSWEAFFVIKLDFSLFYGKDSKDLETFISLKLNEIAKEYSLNIPKELNNNIEIFAYIIKKLGKEKGIVVLIDEYDKPLTDNIFSSELESLSSYLGAFYQVLKSCSEYIRFAFITGVTKLAKLSMFSKLNNITDISFMDEYSAMFGYTQEELESYFKDRIEEAYKSTEYTKEEYLLKLKSQYNGYCFTPKGESVYNPVSIGLFFISGGRDFINFWAETGNPKLLIDIAKEIDFSIINDITAITIEDFSSFNLLSLSLKNIDKTNLVLLMFQSGYLTIKDIDKDGYIHLGYPNNEVAKSYFISLLKAYKTGKESGLYADIAKSGKLFSYGETAKAIEMIKSFFSSLSYDVISKTTKSPESFYQACFYSYICGTGITNLILEDRTNIGRIDLSLQTLKECYVIEFKVDNSSDNALNQIKENHYFDKFRFNGKNLHLLGINFSSSTRNIESWKEEIINL